jgi:hypothetical protein
MSLRIPRPLIAASLLVLLASCGQMRDEATDGGDVPPGDAGASESALNLDAAQREGLGVVLAPLLETTYEARSEGQALVLDVQPAVQAMAELNSAEAAARQSAAARERATALFGSDAAVSREAVEAAERQAAADAAALDTVRARTLVAYGNAAPWLDAARRTRILAALTRGDGVVVRASFPAGLPGGERPSALSLRPLGERSEPETWRSVEVWLGPADPAVPGPALYAYVEPAPDLVSGVRLVASFASGLAQTGVTVPTSAIVFSGGTAWCYVFADGSGLARLPVDLSRPAASGYFQASGFEAGQQVVIAGAGLLLATEVGGPEEED